MIDIWFKKFSTDTFIKQIERTQALACGVRPRIYCNEIMCQMFDFESKYNGCEVVIDDELDDGVFIIMSCRDKYGNVVLPYIFGNITDDLLDRLYFTLNDYKWAGYPDNIIRKEKVNIIEKTFGVKIECPDYSYCICEELIRLNEEKCGVTSYPVVGIGNSENDKPVIWCKPDVGDEWNIIVPEKDENGQYHRFYVPETRACKLVDVKYCYKKEVGDYWFMGKRQIERVTKEH